ncbi:hypothetical protein CROQUDRAFT_657324 [Cronartium quercuum f. sp. fusiforme G11]|uniref:Uncharacterized protein n=1 Tax=Cronartium quercuum f. sp. fusiforme G11 TaxID=708437 RepID=A0A9P6TBQ5_9BASI|nr:hypothetical protein CROQUDRAFT_657324 [Cronartium quercuum f. sp. fusiforme G11]
MDEQQQQQEIIACQTNFTIYLNQPSKQTIESIQNQIISFTTSNYFHFNKNKSNFIWHHSKLPKFEPSKNFDFLSGKLKYGNSIQDEWFLVWCLYNISQKFNNTLIQISDDDGEFLIIEAANHLPNWLTPELAQGRVWIKSGSLHLIPIKHPLTKDYINTPLPISNALSILRNESLTTTIANSSINDIINKRLQNSNPEQLTQNHLFNIKTYLHLDLYKLLKLNPSLIGEAINAFCEKDRDDLKVCQTMPRFYPTPLPESNSTTTTTTTTRTSVFSLKALHLTRPLYAQLLNHQMIFNPPKPFIKSNWFNNQNDPKELKRRMISMKLLCGFEILFYHHLNNLNLLNFNQLSINPKPKIYQNYLNKLKKLNYFQDLLEGSQEWNLLEIKARENFLIERNNNYNQNNENELTNLIKILDNLKSGEEEEVNHSNFETESDIESESDSWLDINDEMLNNLLKQDFNINEDNIKPTDEEERMMKGDVEKLLSFTERVENFVEGEGRLEGALHSDDEHSSDEDDTEEDSEQEELRADLLASSSKLPNWTKPKSYDDEMSRKRLETLVPGIDQADWGQKDPVVQIPSPSLLSSNTEVNLQPIAATHTLKPITPLPPNSSEQESNSSTSVSTSINSKPKKRGMKGLVKESYDGVYDESSCEESDDDNEGLEEQGDEKKPRKESNLVVDVDMDSERDEFLNFAREALGLSEDQYQSILDSRRQRGAYVPPITNKFEAEIEKDFSNDEGEEVKNSTKFKLVDSQPTTFKGKGKIINFTPTIDPELSNMTSTQTKPNLNSFESLMTQMDKELKRHKQKGGPLSLNEGPDLIGKQFNHPNSNSDDSDSDSDVDLNDLDEVMENELKNLMKKSDVIEENDHENDYEQISNFLESFKSQMGQPGPVGNLAGRVGLNLLGTDK